MRDDFDVYRTHLRSILSELYCRAIDPETQKFKVDPRSQEIKSMIKGVNLAVEAWDLCKKAEAENAGEDKAAAVPEFILVDNGPGELI